jgi:hypothetical protein
MKNSGKQLDQKVEDQLLEQLDGQIDQLLAEFHELETWTTEKHYLRDRLEEFLMENGYDWHRGKTDPFYGLVGIGNDRIEQIPPKRRGHLQPYRDRIVRIICIGGGRYERTYAVGPTSRQPTPPHPSDSI